MTRNQKCLVLSKMSDILRLTSVSSFWQVWMMHLHVSTWATLHNGVKICLNLYKYFNYFTKVFSQFPWTRHVCLEKWATPVHNRVKINLKLHLNLYPQILWSSCFWKLKCDFKIVSSHCVPATSAWLGENMFNLQSLIAFLTYFARCVGM